MHRDDMPPRILHFEHGSALERYPNELFPDNDRVFNRRGEIPQSHRDTSKFVIVRMRVRICSHRDIIHYVAATRCRLI